MASPTDGNCKPRPRALLWRLRRLPEPSQSSARAAGDETDINIDSDRHDPTPEILLAATLPLSYRGPTVGMAQSQTLDWGWTGENK